MTPSQIGCIVFRENNNVREFLLLKRIPEKKGFWQYITGEVDNESLLNAVFREAQEEAGIEQNDVLRTIENVSSFEYKNVKKDCLVTEYVFGLEVKPKTKITLEKNIYKEHEEFKWVRLEEAMQLLHFKTSKESLKKLVQLIDI